MSFVLDNGDTNRLIAPTGKNLTTSNATLAPVDGALAYNESDQSLYYGKNYTWNILASGGQGPIGPQGPPGAQGPQGPQGPQGIPGTSYSPVDPSLSKVIYVTKFGDDTTGDGSLAKPFVTLYKAVTLANTLSTLSNPISIQISPGVYTENNNAGPIIINASGISVVGASSLNVFISPSSVTNTLLSINFPIQVSDITFQSNSPSGACFNLTSGNLSRFSNIRVNNFLTGILFSGSSSTYTLNRCAFIANTTALTVNNTIVECTDCDIFGKSTNTDPPANTGILTNGSSASIIFSGGVISLCETGVNCDTNSFATIIGTVFRRNKLDVNQVGSSRSVISSCDFRFTTNVSEIDVLISGTGTFAKIIGCNFNGKNTLGVPQGTCIKVVDGAVVALSGGCVQDYTTALQIGDTLSTSSTQLTVNSGYIDGCVTDILQQGSSTLNFNSGTMSGSKISLTNSSNVTLSYCNLDFGNALEVGKHANSNSNLLQADIGNSQNPGIDYISSLYSTQAIGYHNPSVADSTLFSLCDGNDGIASITTDRSKYSSIKLVSDEGANVGSTSALRGWEIQKRGTTAELSFSYQNTDLFGQISVPQYTLFEMDGLNNQINLPNIASKLFFGGDTNLYRSSANVLKTDDDFIVNTLTPSRVVVTDANNKLASSSTTDTQLGYLSGITSDIQTQLSSKLSKAGDTMTGALQVPSGSTASPSLNFSSNTNTGFSATSNNLSISTNGVERLKVSSSGVVSINGLTPTGVVHNDSFGNLTSSLIVNSDITNGTITDAKLATISSVGKVANSATTATSINTANTIVSRDVSGNFSAGTITASLTGNVTGNASGNVLKSGDTMTGALQLPAGSSASPSLKFTGSTNTGISASVANTLSLDTLGVQRVKIDGTGNVTVNNLNSVGVVHTDINGTLSTSLITNSDITNSTISNSKLASISTTDTADTIVLRDNFGNFSTNQITINGTVSNPTDAATKDYVDSAISTGLVAKTPAVAVSTANLTLSGPQTVDDIGLVANDRILLTGQTNTIENGLWVVQAGAWTRPTDFNTGNTAGQAYVLITSGTLNGGSSWLCNTPSAIIDTDPITFAQFSLPNQLTGANVGAGTGQVFKNKVGNNLNFRSLLSGTYTTITNNTNDITISTNATNLNTANTIVSRDVSGNFSANVITSSLIGNVTGIASGNVAKTGDSMSGNLNMLTQNAVRFEDASGGEYVGINAPNTVSASYTLSLPSTSPLTSQTLRSSAIPTELEWVTTGGSVIPSSNRVIYVSKNGNDISGNGSLDSPYASLSKAVELANTLSTSTTPVTIYMKPGVYTEDNSISGISVNVLGVTITGDSVNSVVIMPNTPANDLLIANQTLCVNNVSFMSNTPSGTGIRMNSGDFSMLNNIKVINFLVGLECTGATSSYLCECSTFIANGTAIVNNNTVIQNNAVTIVGSASLYGAPANTGLSISGSVSVFAISGGSCVSCITGYNIGSDALLTASGVVFKLNESDIVQSGASHMTLSACTFAISTNSTNTDVQISGTGTYAEIMACQFNGKDAASVPGSTAIYVSGGASVDINSGVLKNYTTALKVGSALDTSTTQMLISGCDIHNCTTDILQNGTSTLGVNSTTASASKININDSTNVTLSFFNAEADGALEIGNLTDIDTTLIQVAKATANNPGIEYKSSLYSTSSIGINNPTVTNSTFFALSNGGESNVTNITTDRTKAVSLNLFSDTGAPVGTTTALRGWTVKKNATSSELAFRYRNSDIVGQVAVPEFTLVQFDGLNNQFQLPAANTQLIFGGDTNLYRSSANILKTDDDFIVNTLTADRVVITDGTKKLASSAVTSTELSYLTGVTSSIQTQLNNKASASGSTFTGAIQLPAGTTASPSLNFTGSPTTGLSATTDNLSFSTGGVERMKISSSGTVSINQFTIAGVVHNDASGNLSSSLIVNNDITNGTITDAKLATITTAGKVANSATTATDANTASAIVSRDVSGNFSATTVTLSGNIALVNSTSTVGNITKAGDRFIHNYGTNNTFTGVNTGNFTLTANSCSAFGTGALTSLTSGNRNIGIGYNAGSSITTGASNICISSGLTEVLTTGSNNILVGSIAGSAGDTGIIRIGTSGTHLKNFQAGIRGITPDAADGIPVYISSTGQLCTSGSGGTYTASAPATATDVNGIIVGANTLQLEYATASFPGILSTGTQTIAGAKTLSNTLTLSAALELATTTGIAVGTVTQNGSRFIHSYGTNNLFIGSGSGNYTMTATQQLGIGPGSLAGSTSGSQNLGLGYNTLLSCTSGFRNIAIGATALDALTTTNDCIAIGVNAGSSITTGADNICIGFESLKTITTNNRNTAIGSSTLSLASAGIENTAIGWYSMAQGVLVGSYNTAVGAESMQTATCTEGVAVGVAALLSCTAIGCVGVGVNALRNSTSPTGLVAVGYQALQANTTGTGNVAMGYQSLLANTIGINNTGLGYQALLGNTSGNYNTGIGWKSLAAVTTAIDNTGVGYNTLVISTGASNNAFGSRALQNNTTGINNVAIGVDTIGLNNTGSANVAIGNNALANHSTDNTVAIGHNCLTLNTTGSRNTGCGYSALASVVIFSDNTAFGYNALTLATGASNTAFGSQALDANTTGTNNVGVGLNALGSIVTGSQATAVGTNALALNTASGNTAVGYNALASNTSSGNNTAVGNSALAANTGSENTVMGTSAAVLNTTGTRNTVMGYNAFSANLIGSNCVAIGYQALLSCTADTNVAVGSQGGRNITSGTNNSCFGHFSGFNISTGSNNLCLGANAGSSLTTGSNNIYLNHAALSATDTSVCRINYIRGVTTGSATGITVLIDANGQLGTVSSLREKKMNIEDVDELENKNIISKLIPRRFDFKTSKGKYPTYGMIVDEVIDIAPQLICDDDKGEPHTIFYERLPIMLLKEVQRMNKENEDLKLQVKNLMEKVYGDYV